MEFRSPRGRAKVTVAVFYVLLATMLYTIGADVYGLAAVDAGLDGDAGAEDMLSTSDTLDVTSAIAYTAVSIVLVVVFLMWFHRAYKNLPALGMARPPRSAGWAVGSWFVPFFSWVIPLLSANDIWRSGDTESSAEGPWEDRPVATLVTLWWVAWLLASVGGNIAGRIWWDAAGELDEYRTAYIVDMGFTAVSLAAALLAIAFVRRATLRQEARAEQFATGQVPPPPPPEEFRIEPAWKPSDELGS